MLQAGKKPRGSRATKDDDLGAVLLDCTLPRFNEATLGLLLIRVVVENDEIARAEAAIRSAQSVWAKEQAQRDELAPFLPTPATDRVLARAS
jgi:hypothetical protein